MSRENRLPEEMRSDAQKIFRAALQRVNPYEALRQYVRVDGRDLRVGRAGQGELRKRLG